MLHTAFCFTSMSSIRLARLLHGTQCQLSEQRLNPSLFSHRRNALRKLESLKKHTNLFVPHKGETFRPLVGHLQQRKRNLNLLAVVVVDLCIARMAHHLRKQRTRFLSHEPSSWGKFGQWYYDTQKSAGWGSEIQKFRSKIWKYTFISTELPET